MIGENVPFISARVELKLNLCLQVQEGVHGLHQSEQMVVAVDLG